MKTTLNPLSLDKLELDKITLSISPHLGVICWEQFPKPLKKYNPLLDKAQAHLDSLTKPPGSLGTLEELANGNFPKCGSVYQTNFLINLEPLDRVSDFG